MSARARPSQVVALVAALAALAIAGRIAFAAFPNVKPTTDIVIFAGYALGPAPGFAVGAPHRAGLELLVRAGAVDAVADGGVGVVRDARRGAGGGQARDVGRLTLAAVCGLAGIAYGALLNFSLMATYGGDLSLRALPRAGVPRGALRRRPRDRQRRRFALIAGPAMVRMLVRFRERFEWRAPAVVSVLLLALALASVLPARAQASSPGRAAIWLASVQNDDGGWGSSSGSASSTATTAWVMLGLESVDVNPLDVSKGGHSAVDYLRARVGDLGSRGDFARTILALEGAGLDPRSFGGANLVSALVKQRRDDGSYEGWPGSTAFAIIALRAAGATGSLRQSTAWLAKAQNGDGGWGDTPGSPSTADVTGAAMQAMPDTRPPTTASVTCATPSGPTAASPSAAPAGSTRSRRPGRCRGCWPWARTPPRCRTKARARSTTSPPARTTTATTGTRRRATRRRSG